MVCFPEYAISGWPYLSEQVINGLAEAVPGNGPWYKRYQALAKEIGVPVLCWLVESADGKLYNCAFLLDGKGQFKGKYRKVQANLLEQAEWGWSQGEHFQVIELDGVRYGISICADMFFPETVRCYELMGADLIIHISLADDMGHIVPTRAVDSKMPIVAVLFRGGSYAVDAKGKLLKKLPAASATWTSFTLEPFLSFAWNDSYSRGWIDEKKAWENIRNVGAYQILVDPRAGLRGPTFFSATAASIKLAKKSCGGSTAAMMHTIQPRRQIGQAIIGKPRFHACHFRVFISSWQASAPLRQVAN